MITEDQAAVIGFLSRATTYGVERVERIDTHASAVFLAGDRAYKLKRAVQFDYLDFSTSERRRVLCEAEVRLNRRTAPSLYRGVIAVTRESDGTYALGGDGPPADWVVEMNRFPQHALLDRLAAAGRLDRSLMSPLGAAIAAFHATAEVRGDHGGRTGMAWVIEGNADGLAAHGSTCLDPVVVRRLTAHARDALETRAALLEHRRVSGYVRQCHGDLHLRNMVLIDGQPTLFDGVEFNDEIACTDVLYDLAFLLMDLWRRRLPQHANAVWNRYLGETSDLDGLSALPLFLSCRAAVRAKTSVTAARMQEDAARRLALEASAGDYLQLAERLLAPPAPVLIAIGGLSGSGKSTLALTLAPLVGAVPGAIVCRSDEMRKRMSGVPLLQRLGPEHYSAPMSARVYAALRQRARQAIEAGHSAIVDAVFVREEDRRLIEDVAAAASVPFVGVWLDAPEPVLIERTERRREDASDADAAVIRRQRAQDPGAIRWHRIDAAVAPASVLDTARDHLRTHSAAVEVSEAR